MHDLYASFLVIFTDSFIKDFDISDDEDSDDELVSHPFFHFSFYSVVKVTQTHSAFVKSSSNCSSYPCNLKDLIPRALFLGKMRKNFARNE